MRQVSAAEYLEMEREAPAMSLNCPLQVTFLSGGSVYPTFLVPQERSADAASAVQHLQAETLRRVPEWPSSDGDGGERQEAAGSLVEDLDYSSDEDHHYLELSGDVEFKLEPLPITPSSSPLRSSTPAQVGNAGEEQTLTVQCFFLRSRLGESVVHRGGGDSQAGRGCVGGLYGVCRAAKEGADRTIAEAYRHGKSSQSVCGATAGSELSGAAGRPTRGPARRGV